MSEKVWPNIGSKIMYVGTHTFWFSNIVEDANNLLETGKYYTISKLELASSWCGVRLEEIPDKLFALSFFSYPKELTTVEAMKIERESWNTVKYEHVTLEELKERTIKHADEVVDVCTKHSEDLKNCKSPREFINHCDYFQNLMAEYEADTDKILKGLKTKKITDKL